MGSLWSELRDEGMKCPEAEGQEPESKEAKQPPTSAGPDKHLWKFGKS